MSKSDFIAFAAISIVIHLCGSVFITGYYGPSGSGTARESFTEVSFVQSKAAEPETPEPVVQEQSDTDTVSIPDQEDDVHVPEETPADIAETAPVAPETLEPTQEAASPEAGSDSEPPFGIALPLECTHQHSGYHVQSLYRSPYMEELGATGVEMVEGVLLKTLGEGGGPAIASFYEPEYPALAVRYGMRGRVVLRLFLDSYGNIQEVLVLESAGSVLDEAAVQAAANSSYHPATEDGRPVSCYALLPVDFELTPYSN